MRDLMQVSSKALREQNLRKAIRAGTIGHTGRCDEVNCTQRPAYFADSINGLVAACVQHRFDVLVDGGRSIALCDLAKLFDS